jgi:pyrroline-5-carboxylate reductase
VGFPRDVAIKLVLATLRGSSSYAMQSEHTVATLKHNVSPTPALLSAPHLCYVVITG